MAILGEKEGRKRGKKSGEARSQSHIIVNEEGGEKKKKKKEILRRLGLFLLGLFHRREEKRGGVPPSFNLHLSRSRKKKGKRERACCFAHPPVPGREEGRESGDDSGSKTGEGSLRSTRYFTPAPPSQERRHHFPLKKKGRRVRRDRVDVAKRRKREEEGGGIVPISLAREKERERKEKTSVPTCIRQSHGRLRKRGGKETQAGRFFHSRAQRKRKLIFLFSSRKKKKRRERGQGKRHLPLTLLPFLWGEGIKRRKGRPQSHFFYNLPLLQRRKRREEKEERTLKVWDPISPRLRRRGRKREKRQVRGGGEGGGGRLPSSISIEKGRRNFGHYFLLPFFLPSPPSTLKEKGKKGGKEERRGYRVLLQPA